jgi:23S rRNA (uracil1939-C5)-methyltransferase
LLLNIEKLIYGGDGLARLAADERGRGKAVFVPFVLAQEKIEAEITEEKPGFARARAAAIVEPSAHRVAPPCPHFGRCGGCHYQHATYEHQLEIKKEILRENLRRIAKVELTCEIQVHPSPPWNYRNRSRLQVRTRPSFAAGYFKFGSHELLPVEECPISSPLVNRGIAALWQAGRAGKIPEGVREVEFFAASDEDGNETQVLLEVLCDPEARRAEVRACAEDLCASMPKVVGVAAFREPRKGVQEPLVAVGDSYLTYKVKAPAHSLSYRVSAGSFFQTNRFLTGELIEMITAGRSGDLALDLYAGVGLFSTALACNFRHTVSVESSQSSTGDLQYNLADKGKAVQATAEQYLAAPSREGGTPHATNAGAKGVGRKSARAGAGEPSASLRTSAPAKARGGGTKDRVGNGSVLPHSLHPDLIVVDPPRGGLGDGVARALASANAPRITYVSCDPATLARDLVPLQTAGYRVEEVHLVDLFPQTYHLETVIKLVLR